MFELEDANANVGMTYLCAMNIKSPIGLLRLLGILEGTSLILLMCVAVPLKRLAQWSEGVAVIGPIHGVLFLFFVLATLYVSIDQKWSFTKRTWKVLLACIIPFGTFYVDRKILKGLSEQPQMDR
jgi:integral membrane protein